MKITVITTDFGAAVNVGGGTETFCKSFDIPDEMAEYIRKQKDKYSTVTLGIDISDDEALHD